MAGVRQRRASRNSQPQFLELAAGEEETEDEWWLDIAEDVREECAQFGEVTHAFVDRESEGFVYLKFADVAGASKAKDALHGRWFAGRTVAAEFQFTAVYDRHFDA